LIDCRRRCIAGGIDDSSADSLSSGPRGRARSAPVRRSGRPQPGPVRTRRGDVEHLPRLPVQDGPQAAEMEPEMVRLRPVAATPRLLRRQAGVPRVGARLHLLPVDPGRLRRPPTDGRPQSQPDADVLRQDRRPDAVSDGAQRAGDARLDRRHIHRSRGLPTVPVNRQSGEISTVSTASDIFYSFRISGSSAIAVFLMISF